MAEERHGTTVDPRKLEIALLELPKENIENGSDAELSDEEIKNNNVAASLDASEGHTSTHNGVPTKSEALRTLLGVDLNMLANCQRRAAGTIDTRTLNNPAFRQLLMQHLKAMEERERLKILKGGL